MSPLMRSGRGQQSGKKLSPSPLRVRDAASPNSPSRYMGDNTISSPTRGPPSNSPHRGLEEGKEANEYDVDPEDGLSPRNFNAGREYGDTERDVEYGDVYGSEFDAAYHYNDAQARASLRQATATTGSGRGAGGPGFGGWSPTSQKSQR